MERRYPDMIEEIVIQHAGLNKSQWMVEYRNDDFLFIVRKRMSGNYETRKNGIRKILLLPK